MSHLDLLRVLEAAMSQSCLGHKRLWPTSHEQCPHTPQTSSKLKSTRPGGLVLQKLFGFVVTFTAFTT